MIDFKRMLAVLDKEFKDSMKSSVFVVIVILPIILSALFSFLLGGASVSKSHIVVVAEGQTAFLEVLKESENLVIDELDSWAEATQEVRDGEISTAVKIPAGFDDDVKAGKEAEIEIVYDKSKSRETDLAAATIESLLETFTDRKPVAVFKVTPIRDFRRGQLMLPVWITFAAALIGITLMSSNVAEEREKGTLSAMLVTPVSRTEVMLAKAIFGTVLVVISVIVMAFINGTARSNFLLLILLSAIGGFGLVALGLLIGALSRDQRQANTLSTVIYLPIILPVFILGLNPVIDVIAHVLPTYYLWQGSSTLLFSENISSVWVDFLVLAGFAVVLLVVSAVALRRR